jgi:hypothetical protein
MLSIAVLFSLIASLSPPVLQAAHFLSILFVPLNGLTDCFNLLLALVLLIHSCLVAIGVRVLLFFMVLYVLLLHHLIFRDCRRCCLLLPCRILSLPLIHCDVVPLLNACFFVLVVFLFFLFFPCFFCGLLSSLFV